ncbi:MAG: glycosyltransferase [Chloroflexota bacterium]|nr:glycosyltransferase [Chloroflexota bacterium]
MDRKQFETNILLLSDSPKEIPTDTDIPITSILRHPFSSLRILKTLRNVRQTILSYRPNVIVTAFRDEILTVTLASFCLNVSHVLLKVNLSSDRGCGIFPVMLKCASPRIAAIVANSQAGAQVAETSYSRVVSGIKQKVHMIPNGVDTAYYRPPSPSERHAARARLGIPENELCFISLANLKPLKRVDWLLRGVANLKRNTPLRVILAGDGSERSNLQQLADELELSNVTTFCGFVDNVRPLLWAADVSVLCSESEGCSNAILESMACGVPVVASAVGGNTDSLKEQRGLLFSPSDFDEFLRRLREISRRETRYKVAKTARDWILESRSHVKVVEKYQALFECAATR